MQLLAQRPDLILLDEPESALIWKILPLSAG